MVSAQGASRPGPLPWSPVNAGTLLLVVRTAWAGPGRPIGPAAGWAAPRPSAEILIPIREVSGRAPTTLPTAGSAPGQACPEPRGAPSHVRTLAALSRRTCHA